MKYDTVIFDLDGTLLNTLEDLMDAVNYALKQYSMETITYEQTRTYVGNGVAKLVERAVPEGTGEEETGRVLECFKNYYKEHSMDKTRPYEGIISLLKELKKLNIKVAIVSNKFNDAVAELAEIYFKGLVDVAIGEQCGVKKKPAPDMVNMALEKLGKKRDRAVYIGDSEVDVATAENSGMDGIICLWGFRNKEELIKAGAVNFAEKPEDILKNYLYD